MRVAWMLLTGRTLVRFVFTSAVSIGLSAALNAPQPAVTLNNMIRTVSEKYVPNDLWTGQADVTSGAPASPDRQGREPDLVGPGLGRG